MYWSVRTLRQNLYDFILHSSMFPKAPAAPGGVCLCCRNFLGVEQSFSGWRVSHITGVCSAEAASGCAGDAQCCCSERFSPGKSQPAGGQRQWGHAEQGDAQAKQPQQNCSFFSVMQMCTLQCLSMTFKRGEMNFGLPEPNIVGSSNRSTRPVRREAASPDPCPGSAGVVPGPVLTLLTRGL